MVDGTRRQGHVDLFCVCPTSPAAIWSGRRLSHHRQPAGVEQAASLTTNGNTETLRPAKGRPANRGAFGSVSLCLRGLCSWPKQLVGDHSNGKKGEGEDDAFPGAGEEDEQPQRPR